MLPFVVEFWHWWIFAVLLVVIEIFAPGTIFLWMGVAAGLTGAIMLVFPAMEWEYQLLSFAIISVASVAGWLFWRSRHKAPEETYSTLNRRGQAHVGRQFVLEEPIVNGRGRIHVDDTYWRITCDEDLEAGARVMVTQAVDTDLIVRAAASPAGASSSS